MEVRLSGHGAYRTEYHIVWITKYRYRVLNPGVKVYLTKLFPKVVEEIEGCEIIKFNIQPDHVHMLMVIPPKYAVSAVIGKMKGKTGSALRKKFGWMKLRYARENIVWSPGYFVSTVGVDEEKILNYVKYQGRQDSGQAKLEL